jgi:hypothetical protein
MHAEDGVGTGEKRLYAGALRPEQFVIENCMARGVACYRSEMKDGKGMRNAAKRTFRSIGRALPIPMVVSPVNRVSE